MSYLTVDELRKAPYSISEQECDNDHANILLELAKDTIEQICGQSFIAEGTESTPVEKRIDGNGKLTIMLPYRMESLDKVRDYSTETGYVDYEGSNFIVKPYYLQWKELTNITARTFTYSFSKGTGNIGIFGVWGWNTTPKMIRYAQGKLVKKLLNEDALTLKKQSESLGDYSFTAVEQEHPITGDPEIDLILKQHRLMTYDVSF